MTARLAQATIAFPGQGGWRRRLAAHEGAAWLALTLFLVLISTRSYAGAWNDGSRLATVESLVDRHTLAIDQSIFIVPSEPSPYRDVLSRLGSRDKIRVGDHYYSDKPPVPALPLAGVYALWRGLSGKTAASHPAEFCYLMNLGSSGLALVIAVGCLWAVTGRLGLTRSGRRLLTASFLFCTVAVSYSQHVNNHALLLGLTMALLLAWVRWKEDGGAGGLVLMGTLAGLGYTIDLGVGPLLLASFGLLLAWRVRRLSPLLLFATAALPWLALHHALNYHVGGTWGPANAVQEYLDWPGSPFTSNIMTGRLHDRPLGRTVLYLLGLLFGRKGFIGHNLPLLLTLPAVPWLWRRREERAEVAWCAGWAGAVWLLYGLASTNSAGVCCTIRWFVPVLAPGYYLLALLLRERPRSRPLLVWLSLCAAAVAIYYVWQGPWHSRTPPIPYWILQSVALLGCWVLWRHGRAIEAVSGPMLLSHSRPASDETPLRRAG